MITPESIQAAQLLGVRCKVLENIAQLHMTTAKNNDPDWHRARVDRWKEINLLVSQIPTYQELSQFFETNIVHCDGEEILDWRSIGLSELLRYASYDTKDDTDRKDKVDKEKRQAEAKATIEKMITLGYGEYSEPQYTQQKHALSYFMESPYLPKWIEQFGTKNLHKLLNHETSQENIQYIIELDKQTPLSKEVRSTIPYQLINLIKKLREEKDKIEQEKTKTIITESLKHLTQINILPAKKTLIGLIKASFYSPEWTKLMLGSVTNLNTLIDRNDKQEIHGNFFENVFSNQEEWAVESKYFKELAYQISLAARPEEIIGKASSIELLQILLNHPDLVDTHLDLSRCSDMFGVFQLFRLGEPTSNEVKKLHEEKIQIAKLISSRDITIGSWDLCRLANYGLDIETFRTLLDKANFSPKAEDIAAANRPDLLTCFNQDQINWFRVGATLPEQIIDLSPSGISILDSKWEDTLTASQKAQVVAGNIACKIEDMARSEGNIGTIKWLNEMNHIISQLDMDGAICTNFIAKIAKQTSAPRALQIAQTLKLNEDSLNYKIIEPNTYHSHFSLEEEVIASGKIRNIQKFNSLGGNITQDGVNKAIEEKKEKVLEYIIANSNLQLAEDTPIRYLARNNNECNVTLLNIIKRSKIENPASLVNAILQAHQSPEVTNMMFSAVLEKVPAQKVFDQVIATLERPEDSSTSNLLTMCVLAGAAPNKSVIKKTKYENTITIQTTEAYLGTLGKKLVEIYQAKEDAKKVLSTTQNSNDLDIF